MLVDTVQGRAACEAELFMTVEHPLFERRLTASEWRPSTHLRSDRRSPRRRSTSSHRLGCPRQSIVHSCIHNPLPPKLGSSVQGCPPSNSLFQVLKKDRRPGSWLRVTSRHWKFPEIVTRLQNIMELDFCASAKLICSPKRSFKSVSPITFSCPYWSVCTV